MIKRPRLANTNSHLHIPSVLNSAHAALPAHELRITGTLVLLLTAGLSIHFPQSLLGTSSYVFINEVVFGDVPRIQRARHHQLSLHGSAKNHFHHIHEILFLLEATDELGVIWSSGGTQKNEKHKLLISYEQYFVFL